MFDPFFSEPSASSAVNLSSPRPRLMQPPSQDAYLAEGVAAYLLRQEQEGSAARTLQDSREAAWSFFEFLGGDLPIRELSRDVGARWLDWLRTTPSYRRQRGSYPTQFTHGSVSAFFGFPPMKHTAGRRGPETVAKYWRTGSAILRFLGVALEVERRKRRRIRRLPPIVPKLDAIGARWRDVLTTKAGTASANDRRQVVLTQALILLWGTRLHEALSARLEDVEGHWCLVEGKTGMRFSYLNSQALGLVEALRGQTLMPWAADRWFRISGWPWGLNTWHAFVRDCGAADGKQPPQDLRRRFSTWVNRRDAEVEKLLCGHGGGVIFDYYLDIMERVPAVLESFTLPEVGVDGFAWPAPVFPHKPAGAATWGPAEEAAAAKQLTPPAQLYARFDAWLDEQELLAALPC